MEIAIVGADDFVTGFALAGVRHTYVAEDAETLEKELDKVMQMNEIGILVMEEDQFNTLGFKRKTALEKMVKPVLITISDKGKETNIREMIKRSIGVDLWK